MKFTMAKFQTFLEIIGLILVLGMILYLGIRWNQIPDQIPGHYNAKGEITKWTSKKEMLALPAVSILIYFFISAISLIPTLLFHPDKSGGKSSMTFRTIKLMLTLSKVEMISIFIFIIYYISTAAPLPSAFLPVSLILFFATPFVFAPVIIFNGLRR